MRLGQAAMEALRAEITGCLKPGDELVVACPVALKGTSVIAKNKKDKLAERFSAGFIQNCISLRDDYGAGSIVWKIAQESDAMYYILLSLMIERHGYAIMKYIEELSNQSITIRDRRSDHQIGRAHV